MSYPEQAVEPGLQGLVRRLQSAEPDHLRRLDWAVRHPKTNWSIRRGFLSHRSLSHSLERGRLIGGTPIGERAWSGWTTLRWIIEIALSRMRDPLDRKLLEDRNQSKFRFPAVPSIQWLMEQAGAKSADETAQYENVLRWVLRPELYAYRWREFGGEEFKRLKHDRKGDPQLLRQKLVFESTGVPEYPLQTDDAGTVLRVRVNGFPDEPLYTLIIGEKEAADFDNWPKSWKRPVTASDLS
jgi:hypothetical protein